MFVVLVCWLLDTGNCNHCWRHSRESHSKTHQTVCRKGSVDHWTSNGL